MNNDGTFYQCVCQPGAMTSGTGASLTCVGELYVIFMSHFEIVH